MSSKSKFPCLLVWLGQPSVCVQVLVPLLGGVMCPVILVLMLSCPKATVVNLSDPPDKLVLWRCPVSLALFGNERPLRVATLVVNGGWRRRAHSGLSHHPACCGHDLWSPWNWRGKRMCGWCPRWATMVLEVVGMSQRDGTRAHPARAVEPASLRRLQLATAARRRHPEVPVAGWWRASRLVLEVGRLAPARRPGDRGVEPSGRPEVRSSSTGRRGKAHRSARTLAPALPEPHQRRQRELRAGKAASSCQSGAGAGGGVVGVSAAA